MEMIGINGEKLNIEKYQDKVKWTGEGAKIITEELVLKVHEKSPELTRGNIELPETIKICEGAFMWGIITNVYAPELIEIENRAFNECRELEHVHAPKVTDIGDYGFVACINLKWVYFPELVNVGEKTFYCCFSLRDFYSPKLKKIGKDAFRGCKKLNQ